MKTTVKTLRDSGSLVRVTHYRYPQDNQETLKFQGDIPGPKRHPRGGGTQIIVSTKDKEELVGESLCSRRDGFNRRTGLQLALDRLKVVVVNEYPAS